ncbi:transposase [Desulfatitalea alkaliphila]|uniref:Transposase n=1 Tax=Desulfatitalea alkaliphila TaxID=2929485 RepID=A0AA41R6A2_9BACT|nr:transposase [Desulfatitalea alkaliphila]MCJ8501925.1 transposase [Desulfatitalea alkaliphila]
MPRKARIDAPGALHHIIVRGIARQKIFDDDADRDAFLERLGAIIQESHTQCYAWALIPNHFHLLLKTGATPIATVMKRLLTGYAMGYNRRHKRCGHLFQNRYKSILCQEDSYLLELVRYIHLNPLRARLVADMEALDRYPYCGHSVLMGKVEAEWQNTDYVAGLFDGQLSTARRMYRDFVQKGIADGKRDDLVGGGLIRSAGGWATVKALRKADALQKGDERILGDGDFVERVLAEAEETLKRKYKSGASGLNLDDLAGRAAEIIGIDTDQMWSGGKQTKTVQARRLLCYWATHELGMSQAALSKRLQLSPSAISLAVARGRELVKKHKWVLQT